MEGMSTIFALNGYKLYVTPISNGLLLDEEALALCLERIRTSDPGIDRIDPIFYVMSGKASVGDFHLAQDAGILDDFLLAKTLDMM